MKSVFTANVTAKNLLKLVCASSMVVALNGCETINGWMGKESGKQNAEKVVPASVPAKKTAAPKKKSADAKKFDAQFSGYLVSYSEMTESHTPSGGTRLGWVSPDLKKGQYTAIMIDPVGFYPKPPVHTKVSKGQMLAAVQYLVKQVKLEVGHDLKIVDQPGPGVLRWDAAITSIKSAPDVANPQINQPVALFFADSAPTAASATDNNGLLVFLESRLVDTQTQKVMAKSVRAGMGRALADPKAKITMTEMKPVLDGWVQDAGVFVRERIK